MSYLLNRGRKNALINANFNVWQRGTTFASSGGQKLYSADRWAFFNASAGTGMTVAQVADPTFTYTNTQYQARVQRPQYTSNPSIMSFYQQVESVNARALRGQHATLSFWVRTGADYSGVDPMSGLPIVTASIITGTGTDENFSVGFTGAQTVGTLSVMLPAPGVWLKVTITTPSAIATGVNEIAVVFQETPTGTAGVADYFDIAQVQLESGASATNFEYTDFATELARCQRYFEALGGTNVNEVFAQGMVISGTNALGVLSYQSKRAPPAASFSAATDFIVISPVGGIGVGIVLTTLIINGIGANSATWNGAVAAGLTSGNSTQLQSHGTLNARLFLNAEI